LKIRSQIADVKVNLNIVLSVEGSLVGEIILIFALSS